MAESSWPTVAGGRAVNDSQWELMSSFFSGDGVYGPSSVTPVVYADGSGRLVKIRADRYASVGGHTWSSGPEEFTVPIAANTSGSTRTDLIVLGLNRTSLAVTAYAKPGSGANPPALDRAARGGTTGVWEIPLASVTVANNATTIGAAAVTDLAWYAYGDTVATTSTNPRQPPVTDYARLRHTDTNLEYLAHSGSWRRAGWNSAWGIVGGRKWPGTGLIGEGWAYGPSLAYVRAETGPVQMYAGRRYRIEFRFQPVYSQTGLHEVGLATQFRKAFSGTIATVRTANCLTSFPWDQVVWADYEPTTDENPNILVWGQFVHINGNGTLNWVGIGRSESTALIVTDVGPAAAVATF